VRYAFIPIAHGNQGIQRCRRVTERPCVYCFSGTAVAPADIHGQERNTVTVAVLEDCTNHGFQAGVISLYPEIRQQSQLMETLSRTLVAAQHGAGPIVQLIDYAVNAAISVESLLACSHTWIAESAGSSVSHIRQA